MPIVAAGQITITDVNDGIALNSSRQGISLSAGAMPAAYPVEFSSGAWMDATNRSDTLGAGKAFTYDTGLTYNVSFFVYVEGDAPLVAGNSGELSGNFSMAVNNGAVSSSVTPIQTLGGGWYRVSTDWVPTSAWAGLYVFANSARRRLWVSGFQISLGAGVKPYQAIGPVYTGDAAARVNLCTDSELTLGAASMAVQQGVLFAPPPPLVIADTLTDFRVMQGGTDVSAAWSLSASFGPGVVGRLHQGNFAASAVTENQTYVDVTATKPGSAPISTRVPITVLQKGDQGTAASSLTLSASAAGFTFTDGVAVPAVQQIAVRALTNYPVLFYASNGATLDTDAGVVTSEGAAFGVPIVGDGDTCYIDLDDFGASEQFYVTAICGDATAVIHLIKINQSTAAAGATRNVFRGDWTSGTAYALGDIAIAGGTSWTCLVQHVASGGNAPPSLPTTFNAYWTQYAAKGDRGTIQAAVATTGTVWSDSEANAAIVAAGGVAPQRGDVVTLYKSSAGFSQTRVFTTGGTWAPLAAFFGGDVLVDGTVVSSKVAASAITTDKLAAGAVDATRLGAGAVVAGKIAAGAVGATEVQAGAIVASKISVSSGVNIYPDYNMIDADYYASSTSSAFSFVGTTSTTLGRSWMNIAPNGVVDQVVETAWFYVEPGVEYLVKGGAWAGASGARAILEFETTTTDLYGNPATSLGRTTIMDATGVFGPASFGAEAIVLDASARKARFVMTRVGAYGGTGGAGFGALTVMRKAAGELIVDGTIRGDHIAGQTISGDNMVARTLTSAHIDAGGIKAESLDINGLLTLDEVTAGFSLGKASANDPSDGLYMGRTEKVGGGVGFGFMMGKTEADGTQRYIQHTSDDGFKIVNANYGLLTDLSAAPVQYSTSQTITLPTTTKLLNLILLGAGGGGAGATGNGGNGGNTIVQLWNGSTNTGISWTANGGLGGLYTDNSKGDGGSTSYGTGGRQAYDQIIGHTGGGYPIYGVTPPTNATGYGAGGGGGGPSSAQQNGSKVSEHQSGAAGALITVSGYNIGALGLTAPKLVVTIGAGGAGGTGNYVGTAGRLGMIYAQPILSDIVPCGVIPLYPTVTGTFTKAANATGSTVFPDLGAGMWVLSVSGGGSTYLNELQITDAKGGNFKLFAPNTTNLCFVANIRPNILVGNSNASTISYAFYKMKTGD